MAVIYYPKNQLLYIRDTVVSASNYESVVLACGPNTVLYFDTSSAVTAESAMNLAITASWALTASVTILFSSSSLSSSYADTASYALNASAGSSISSSWASQSLSASYAPGGVSSAYVTLTTSSVTAPGITCSFLDTKEYVTFNTGSATYYFTSSNVPAPGIYAAITLYINNTFTGGNTSSLSFPAGWKWLGLAPTYITTSKDAELNLESFGGNVVAVWAPQY